MFQRFTDRARRVLVLAQEEARLLNHSYIGTEHLLIGLFRDDGGIAGQALQELGISLEAVHGEVGKILGTPDSAVSGLPAFTPRAKKVLELSLREALQLGHNYIGTEHMLLGLVREGEGVGAQVLTNLGADLGRVRQKVIELLSGYPGATPAQATQLPDDLMIVTFDPDEVKALRHYFTEILGWKVPDDGTLLAGNSHPVAPLFNAIMQGTNSSDLSVRQIMDLLVWYHKLADGRVQRFFAELQKHLIRNAVATRETAEPTTTDPTTVSPLEP